MGTGFLVAFLAAAIIGSPDFGSVTVVGHADRRERHRSALAAKRAEAVRDALIARGVASDRLRTQATNQDERKCPRGRDCDRRRVVFHINRD